MTDSSGSAEIAREFEILNRRLGGTGDRPGTLDRLVALAVVSVPGCDWAAVTAWPTGHRPRSLATSSEVAATADNIQYDAGDGPCLQAASENEPVVIPDLDDSARWPGFARMVQDRTPVRSVMSFHLADEPERVALNLYGGAAGVVGPDAVSTGALFATHARVLLLHAGSAGRAVQLTEALSTSRQIGAAVGILMSVHKITSEQAFDLLRRTSQQLNRKLRSVADDVTQTGILPPTSVD